MFIPKTTRQKELMTGAFCLVFFFGGFGLAELIIRGIEIYRFGSTDDLQVSAKKDSKSDSKKKFYFDDNGLRVPHKNQTIGLVRINNLGYRGPDISLNKPKNTIRIAFLGSSTTYDANSEEGKNWPELTAKLLSDKLKNCNVDFINAGLPGFGLNSMLSYWQNEVYKTKPDILIILPGDMTNDLQIAAKQHGFSNFKKSSWFEENLLLWAKIVKNTQVIRAQRNAFNETGKFQPDLPSLTVSFEQKIENLVNGAKSPSMYIAITTMTSMLRNTMPNHEKIVAADSALYYLPFLSIPKIIKAQDAYNKSVKSQAEKQKIFLIQNEDEIPNDRNHFADTRHFKPAGSLAMAKRIVNSLIHADSFLLFMAENHSGCKLTHLL